MQVTVDIPDQFVEQLVPAGRDPSRSLLEGSVAAAQRCGRITAEQADEILRLAAGDRDNDAFPANGDASGTSEPTRKAALPPEWISDPEQVRLHAAVEKLIGIVDSGITDRSVSVRKIVGDRLSERYSR